MLSISRELENGAEIMTDELLTISEASKKTGISVSAIKRWCVSGEMPALKKGKTWLIKATDLDNHPPLGEWGKGRPKKTAT